jgi:hypothetical protein
MPVPTAPWQMVSVDFITELPKVHGFDAIMVVVDVLGKHSHMIPTHTTITAIGSAQLYLTHVWKLHGLLETMLSDRGPQFIVEFMHKLYHLLDICMALSTAYHPQTDGRTEHVNQELEQYICLFVNERQDNWDELIPMAEFQYNNHVHSVTQTILFMVDHGQLLRMGFKPREASKVEAVNDFITRMKGALEEACAVLTKAKDNMAQYYNR